MKWKKYSGIASMRIRILTAALLCVVTIGIVGCASSSAPRGWLPSPQETKVNQYGSWIEIRLENAGAHNRVDGEFIAVNRDSVFIADSSGLRVIPRAQIRKARITSYDSDYGALAGWTTLGALSTISHGWVLIATCPLWILSGTIATTARSHEGKDRGDRDWESYRKYARYPSGLPGNLDRSKIVAKKVDAWVARSDRRRDRRRRR